MGEVDVALLLCLVLLLGSLLLGGRGIRGRLGVGVIARTVLDPKTGFASLVLPGLQILLQPLLVGADPLAALEVV